MPCSLCVCVCVCVRNFKKAINILKVFNQIFSDHTSRIIKHMGPITVAALSKA
jgi:hypothetical protein